MPDEEMADFIADQLDTYIDERILAGEHPDDAHTYWVWNVEIAPSHRGMGLGRAAMELAEQAARARSAVELGLTVFAHNTVACHLYQSIGYQTTTLTMRKPL